MEVAIRLHAARKKADQKYSGKSTLPKVGNAVLKGKLEYFTICMGSATRNKKKVLLRERKRHTDRGISSTPYAVLSGGEVPTLAGGSIQGKYPPPPRCGHTENINSRLVCNAEALRSA